jgi:hypothetical protein
MSMDCTSLRCCLNGSLLCVGCSFCVFCVRGEAYYCNVATVLMCLPVAQVRRARSRRFVGSRCVNAECTRCHQYFWSAGM